MTNNQDKKCGLCGNLLKNCHFACTETYSSDPYRDERGPTSQEYAFVQFHMCPECYEDTQECTCIESK